MRFPRRLVVTPHPRHGPKDKDGHTWKNWKKTLFGHPTSILRIVTTLGFLGFASYSANHVKAISEGEDEVLITSVNTRLKNQSLILDESMRKIGSNNTPADDMAARLQISQPSENSNKSGTRAHSVYALKFVGDMKASQVESLRREVTAIVETGNPNTDEVVLVLKSSGGGVSEYGLAAAQLERLKTAKFKLTICVDEVAASGGYMMACVGDIIVAAPFSMLGSIGVLSIMPNFAHRMKREGVHVEEISAGQYKTTLMPYSETSPEKRRKAQENVDNIHGIFKSFVSKHRPKLRIDEVATGEVWCGDEALERGLCDALGTSDDVILNYVHAGATVYNVSIKPREKKSLEALLKGVFSGKSVFGSTLNEFFSLNDFSNADSMDSMMTTPRVFLKSSWWE